MYQHGLNKYTVYTCDYTVLYSKKLYLGQVLAMMIYNLFRCQAHRKCMKVTEWLTLLSSVLVPQYNGLQCIEKQSAPFQTIIRITSTLLPSQLVHDTVELTLMLNDFLLH